MHIDLNCDVGESFGRYRLGHDEAVMEFATSISVACGFHAGDAGTMRRTVAAAVARGVAIGAHPGYPDLQGFGRREMKLSAEEIGDIVIYQAGALNAFVGAAGGRLQHVKLHGALYNTAARSEPVAEAAVAAVARLPGRLIIVGPPGSQLAAAAARHGLPFAAEVFADRTYAPDGQLTPRDTAGAFIADAEQAARRMVQLLREGTVEATDGSRLALRADTICLHGDAPNALAFARGLAQALEGAGVKRQALGATINQA
ncbi:MAG TPA: 5-oxoprolinase subunit PxpA [Polyangia bacterium]|nr:5-oxoprolinase subunit PxpA [Polyangia bacterium]